MADDLHEVGAGLSALLANISAPERRKMMVEIARELRRAQTGRIAAQRNPDGSAFVPRKPQDTPAIRSKAGRLKRQVKGRAMFLKIRSASYLRAEGSSDAAAVGFVGQTARIARVHQRGERDRVSKGKTAQYPQRELLGVTEEDRGMIMDAVLRRLDAPK